MSAGDAVGLALLVSGPILGLYAVASVAVVRWRTPACVRYCKACDHDLAGIASEAPCPECNTARRWRWLPSLSAGRLAVWSGASGVICAFGTLAVSAWSFGVLSAESVLFSFPFAAAAPAVAACLLPGLVAGLPRAFAGLAVTLPQAGGLVFASLAIVDAAVWSTDAQSGLVILGLPIAHLAGIGLGLWLALMIGRPAKKLRDLTPEE